MKEEQKTKYIFVTGGVYSSLGKGVVASSIGRILVELGFNVLMQKLDPYLNIDPTFLSPYQHGEVFVTFDGKEADLDLGTYERFIDRDLNKYASVTSGKILYDLLNQERRNGFNGKTVQYVPHVTSAVIDYLKNIKQQNDIDFIIVEIGGTIGDIESTTFLEAISQFKNQYGNNNVLSIHISPLIYIQGVEELKTKPTQHSVKLLRSLGINPNILVLRTPMQVDSETHKKLSTSCSVEEDKVFFVSDEKSVYLVPNSLFSQNIHLAILNYFKLKPQKDNIDEWVLFTNKITSKKQHQLNVAIVGKYVELPDAYKSVIESLNLASTQLDVEINIKYIQPNNIDIDHFHKEFKNINAVILPSISGSIKGFENSMLIASFLRKKDIPTISIGTAVNISLNEYTTNVLHHNNNYVYDDVNDFLYIDNIFQKNTNEKYRIGNYQTILDTNQKLTKLIYGDLKSINERHRHYFEINEVYFDKYLKNDWHILGRTKDSNYIDLIAHKYNQFNVVALFNAEFTSRPNRCNLLFIKLLQTAILNKQNKGK